MSDDIPSTSFNIMEEMDKNPTLKADSLGGHPMVITPVKLPPSYKEVWNWCRAKKLYEELKAVKKTSEKESAKDDLPNVVVKQEVSPVEKKSPTFSKIKTERSVTFDENETMIIDPDSDDEGSTPKRRGRLTSTPKSTSRLSKTPAKSAIKKSKAPSPEPEIVDDDDHERSDVISPSPPAKRSKTRSSQMSTSTPTSRRRVSFEENFPPCTPIKSASQKRAPSPAVSGSSTTPKSRGRGSVTPPPAIPSTSRGIVRTPPITPTSSQGLGRLSLRLSHRKISSGLEASLRRLLVASQLKHQFSSQSYLSNQWSDVSQIEGPTMRNSHGFRVSQHKVQDAKALHEFQHLTIMSVELHCRTRGDFRPDPESDEICGIFYSILNDVPPDKGQRDVNGVLVVDPVSASQMAKRKEKNPSEPGTSRPKGRVGAGRPLLERSGVSNLDVTYVSSETELINEFIDLVKRWEPDICVGWEIQMLSWGYLLQRAAHLSVDLCTQLSRIPGSTDSSHHSAEKDEYGADHMSEIHIAGRIVLNLWRIMRHELTLNIYTFENVAYHVLHQRIPKFSWKTLTSWWDHRTDLVRWQCIENYSMRTKGNLRIMDQVDLVGQTSEFARVFGIEFYHVLSRGSQYRVESMMLRLAKPLNYIPVSPSVQQRAHQRAPDCIPLTLEPQSQFYSHPVVVLDFQSLYPSIMIAYNYCFSTCVGRMELLEKANEGPFEFGCISLQITPKQLKKLKDDVTVCPNGVVFVRQHVRKGVLPKMVEDILKTRVMVKKAMKLYKGDKTLQRLLHARQLGLKLIANVTFGYTSANFSGRMPCQEIGDSIVRKARETLERAIRMVDQHPTWGAKVVYGDTDSLFVLLKGRSKEEAFRLGYEICEAVTADNPKPVKLKFEKVYLPCVLQTKKRYVGYMYETLDQKEPVYDAKGIETVRRDACPAVAKILERSIKLLFNLRDLSQVKQYVQKQCKKLLEGKASLQDYIFAKEYRGMAGYKPGATVPALELAKRLLSKDRRAEPRVGERVPYVIVYGTPGLPLIQLVRQPGELLADASLRINATYYCTKQILPPLDRIFSLLGVDVFSWYNDLPRVTRVVPLSHFAADAKKGTISQYFSSLNCPVCDELTQQGVCAKCKRDPQKVAVVLASKMHKTERVHSQMLQVCFSCMGRQDHDLPCKSLDCPVLYRLTRALRDLSETPHLRTLQEKMLRF